MVSPATAGSAGEGALSATGFVSAAGEPSAPSSAGPNEDIECHVADDLALHEERGHLSGFPGEERVLNVLRKGCSTR